MRVLRAFVLAVLATAAPSIDAASRSDLRCRVAIAALVPKVSLAAFGIVDGCHARRDRGAEGDCNDAAAPKKLALVRFAALARKCRDAAAARAGFPDDLPGALARLVASEVAASGQALQGAPVIGGDRTKARCHRAIGRTRTKLVGRLLRASAACQVRRDRSGATLGAFDPSCFVVSGRPSVAPIGRACRGIGGADVGSCDALPGCALPEIVATARLISAAMFGGQPGAAALFDFAADFSASGHFYDAPYPSDLRLRDDGKPDLTGYPVAPGLPMVASLAAVAALRPAFPAVPVAYFRFSAPLADRSVDTVVPAAPEASLLLVDVESGRLFPVVATTPSVDAWVPEHLLAVGPMPGTVLPAARTYAFVVRRTLGDRDGAPLGVPIALLELRSGGAAAGERARALYAPLWSTLTDLGVAPEDVAAATIFTVGDVVADLAVTTAALRQRHPVVFRDLVLDEVHSRFCELRAAVDFPQFQRGTPDFATQGDFELGPDGIPVKQRDEAAPVVITIPRSTMPVDGYPLVMFFHGPGGLAADVVDRGPTLVAGGDPVPGEGPAHVLAAHGIATVGPAMPLNSERLPIAQHRDVLDLDNLAAYSFTVRQGAIEQRLLLDALQTLTVDPALLTACDAGTFPPGSPAGLLRAGNVGVMGQSTGGQYASMLAALDSRVAGIVPTGSGGFWSFAILQGLLADGVDVSPLIPQLVGTATTLTHLHPALHLLELAWEWGDPITYAPRIAHDPLPGDPARSIYLALATDDPGIPSAVYTAMALASGVEQAGDLLYPPLQTALASAGLAGLQPYPVATNLTSTGGTPYTGVATQYASDGILDGHYIFAQLDAVKSQYACFFDTLLRNGVAVVAAPQSPDSGGVCAPTCAADGQSCAIDGDCCSTSCVGSVCVTGCGANGTSCSVAPDCCSNACASGVCCVDEKCTSNPCAGAGDATATCTDHAAPAVGYDCSCSAGFSFNGISCVTPCTLGSSGSSDDPCGNGGTCTVSGGGWSCSCPVGYVSTAGTQPSCVPVDACSGT